LKRIFSIGEGNINGDIPVFIKVFK
jgi:hypothetical protein